MSDGANKPAEKREVLGLVFRGMGEELERRGLTERVLARLQGESRAVLERPPPHTAWLAAVPAYDDLILAIANETSRQMLRDIIRSTARATTGQLVLPMIKTFINLFGATPASLYTNADRLVALEMRGVHLSYLAEAPTHGVVTVVHCEPVDPLHFTTWEGVLAFAKDVLSVPLVVETAIPDPDGRSARIRVSW